MDKYTLNMYIPTYIYVYVLQFAYFYLCFLTFNLHKLCLSGE